MLLYNTGLLYMVVIASLGLFVFKIKYLFYEKIIKIKSTIIN